MKTAQPAITQMRNADWLQGLDNLCKKNMQSNMVVVEIGVFAGESTLILARHASRVYAIDPWCESYAREILQGCSEGSVKDYILSRGIPPMEQIERLFDQRLNDIENVEKLKGYDEAMLPLFPDNSIDLVYIDSIHTYEAVKSTIKRWLVKLRPNGIMAGHDYCLVHWRGVADAVDEAFGKPDQIFADTSWVVCNAKQKYLLANLT